MKLRDYINEYSSKYCIPNISFTISDEEVKCINIYYSFLNLKFHEFSENFLKDFKLLKKLFKKEIKKLSHDYNNIDTGMPGIWFASKFKSNTESARCIYFKVKPYEILVLLYNIKSKRIYKSYYTYIKNKKDVEDYLKKRKVYFNNRYHHMLELRPYYNGFIEKDKVVITASGKTPVAKISVNNVFKKKNIEDKICKRLKIIGAKKTCEGYDFLNNYKTIYFYLKKCSDLKKIIL